MEFKGQAPLKCPYMVSNEAKELWMQFELNMPKKL